MFLAVAGRSFNFCHCVGKFPNSTFYLVIGKLVFLCCCFRRKVMVVVVVVVVVMVGVVVNVLFHA